MEKKQIGEPGAGMTFIFTMLTMCIWGSYAGIYTGNAALALGLVQFSCYIPYLLGAIILYIKGESLLANIFLIFGTLFGGVGGLTNIAAGIGEIKGFTISPEMTAIPFFWGAVSLIPLLICIRKTASKVVFLCFSAIPVFLTLMLLVTYGILPSSTNVVIKWLCFFVAISGLYNMFNTLLANGGEKPLPEGKPFFK